MTRPNIPMIAAGPGMASGVVTSARSVHGCAA